VPNVILNEDFSTYCRRLLSDYVSINKM